MKKYLVFLLILSVSFLSAQSKFTRYYSLFSIIKNPDNGEMIPTKANVVFDYTVKKIVINKADGGKDLYKINSKIHNSMTADNEKYFELTASDGNYNFLFRFLNNRVLIINTTTRNGLVLYK